MKKILLYTLLVTSLSAAGQMKEGKVVYERTIQMQFRSFGNNPPPEMANMSRERKDKFELSFAANHSLWESLPDMEENNEQPGGGDGNRVMLRMGGGDDLSYTNFKTSKRIEQRSLSNKTYVVEDSIKKLNWKIGSETKTILGHTAQKATAERHGTRFIMSMENGQMKRQEQPDTTQITGWFAQDIPVPAGPEFQGQLPGLILELNLNNGRVIYQALEISSKVSLAAIKEPKGKRISSAQFEKEREKEMEEMRKNMPPGMQIRTLN